MSRQLKRAIVLRYWTRRAIDLGKMGEVARLNHLADTAYSTLDDYDAFLYRDWAFGRSAYEGGELVEVKS